MVAGIRATKPIAQLAQEMPTLHDEFETIARSLEQHYRDMQDMEFTIQDGKLWILQTRDGKRTAQAAVRIAVDLAEAGLITKDEALMRVSADQIDFYLHPQFDVTAIAEAEEIGTGLNVSPGAAVGVVAFDADDNESEPAGPLSDTTAAEPFGTVIDLWYGNPQQFGTPGMSQRWINVLGRATDPNGLGLNSLSFSLNGGEYRPMTIGPGHRRHASTGDLPSSCACLQTLAFTSRISSSERLCHDLSMAVMGLEPIRFSLSP